MTMDSKVEVGFAARGALGQRGVLEKVRQGSSMGSLSRRQDATDKTDQTAKSRK